MTPLPREALRRARPQDKSGNTCVEGVRICIWGHLFLPSALTAGTMPPPMDMPMSYPPDSTPDGRQIAPKSTATRPLIDPTSAPERPQSRSRCKGDGRREVGAAQGGRRAAADALRRAAAGGVRGGPLSGARRAWRGAVGGGWRAAQVEPLAGAHRLPQRRSPSTADHDAAAAPQPAPCSPQPVAFAFRFATPGVSAAFHAPPRLNGFLAAHIWEEGSPGGADGRRKGSATRGCRPRHRPSGAPRALAEAPFVHAEAPAQEGLDVSPDASS